MASHTAGLSARRYVIELETVLAAYLFGGWIGLAVPFTTGNVSPVWPSAGIAVAALMLIGYRAWPAIAAGAFLVNLVTVVPAPAALGIAAGNTAGPLIAVWLMRQIPGFNSALARLSDVLGMLVAVPVGAAVSAAIGTALLFSAGVGPWGTFGAAWRVWWLGDSMGMLIVTPLLLTLRSTRLPSTRETAELGSLVAAVLVACLLLFRPAAGVQPGLVLAAALTPFVLWGAIRFETRGAAIVVFLIAWFVLWKTGDGFGPFARGTTWNNAVLLQAFLATMAVSGLTLAAVIAERGRMIREQARLEGAIDSERKHRQIVDTVNAEMRRAEQESARARETVLLLSKAVEQTADSIILTDSSGRIEYVNPAFEAVTGYTREEAVGATPRLLKSGHHDDEFYEAMWNTLLRGEPFRGTLVNRRKNGERFWAEQTITPLKDAFGNITHFVSVIKDMTEARAVQEQQVQLRLAREVQQRFYTASVQVPGFDIAASARPAEQTGGDYFDLIDTPDGGCYIAIGDVSGHGLDAALVMALTRAYVRAFATLGLPAGEILTRVNDVLVPDLPENRFVTLLLARLYPGSRTIEYSSAGHVPGLLLNRSGMLVAAIESTGVPLGLFIESRFPTRMLRLEPGYVLVLSTDGATESATAADVQFGSEGVLEYVRKHLHDDSRDIADGIYHATRAFAAGGPQVDDVTSVIMKVN